MTGTVNLINFGWMYQGLWQMCKLVLSNEAKAKVNFPKLKDLPILIEKHDIVIGMYINCAGILASLKRTNA